MRDDELEAQWDDSEEAGKESVLAPCCCVHPRTGAWFLEADYAVQTQVLLGLMLAGADSRHASASALALRSRHADEAADLPSWMGLCTACERQGRGRGGKAGSVYQLTYWAILVSILWLLSVVCLWLSVFYFFWQHTPFTKSKLHGALLADLLVGSTAATLIALYFLWHHFSGAAAMEEFKYARLYAVVAPIALWTTPQCCGLRVQDASAQHLLSEDEEQRASQQQVGQHSPSARSAPRSINSGMSAPLLQPRPMAPRHPLAGDLTPSMTQHHALRTSLARHIEQASPETQRGGSPLRARVQSGPSASTPEARHAPLSRATSGLSDSHHKAVYDSLDRRRSVSRGLEEVELELGTVPSHADVTPDGLVQSVEDPSQAA